MAETERHPMSRSARVRAALEAGTVDKLPADLLRGYAAWAGLKVKQGATKDELVAAITGVPAKTTTGKEK